MYKTKPMNLYRVDDGPLVPFPSRNVSLGQLVCVGTQCTDLISSKKVLEKAEGALLYGGVQLHSRFQSGAEPMCNGVHIRILFGLPPLFQLVWWCWTSDW